MMRGDGTGGGNGNATFKSVIIGNEIIVNAGGRFSTNGQTLEIYQDPISGYNNPKRRFTLSVNYISAFDCKTTKNFGEEEFIFILDGRKFPHLAREGKWRVEVLIQDPSGIARMKDWLLGCLGKEGVERLKKPIPRSMVNRFFRPELLTAYSTTTRVTGVLLFAYSVVVMTQHFTYLTGACERDPGAPSQFPRDVICRIIQAKKGEVEETAAHVVIYDPYGRSTSASFDINDAIIHVVGNILHFLSWKTAAIVSSFMWIVKILKTIHWYLRKALPKCLHLVKEEEVTEKQHRKEIDLFWEEQRSPHLHPFSEIRESSLEFEPFPFENLSKVQTGRRTDRHRTDRPEES